MDGKKINNMPGQRIPSGHPSKSDKSGTTALKAGNKPYKSGKQQWNKAQNNKVNGKSTPYRGAEHRPSSGKPATGRATVTERKPVEGMEGMEARRLALKVIRDVTENDAYASLSLNRALTGCGLNPQDRRLVTRLVYDTLDRIMYLDHALNQVMARPDTDIKLLNILRLGACQILLEDKIPESAATNTSVQLCVEAGMAGLKGVCNGILRNLIRRKDELEWPDPETEPVRALSLKYSVPEWLAEKLLSDWGNETEALLAYRNTEATVTVRGNLLEGGEAELDRLLEKKVWGKQPGLLPYSRKINGMADVAQDTDFLSGRFSIQSESSMMACLAVDVRRGKQVLDACAAPGGKTCFLAELMGGTGRVQAWDVHEHRVKLIEAQTTRLKLENVRPMVRDATKFRPEMELTMDAVLLDAPCSGLGVIAEKPDIKSRVSAESIAELTALQKMLLDTVSRYVKKGGTFVYSTCSVLKDENERQIEAFLESHPDFELQKLPETVPEQFRRYEGTGLQLLPHRDGVEGFYICRMKRKA